MKIWEYKLIPLLKTASDQELNDFLNKEGNQGWELCGLDYGCFIFKRVKE